MTIYFVVQIVVNLALLIGVSIALIQTFKKKEDDPRLTQGLRLLQSKISILEDLSDHTENQVKQLMTLLDKKLQEVRGTIDQMNRHIGEVDRSIEKSQKMAEIIQNEIPHEKISEKRMENRYIQAAQMAHRGLSVDEIVEQTGLPKVEVQLITKVNRKQCIYKGPETKSSVQDSLFAKSLEMPNIKSESMDQTQIAFREAVHQHQIKQQVNHTAKAQNQVVNTSPHGPQPLVQEENGFKTIKLG